MKRTLMETAWVRLTISELLYMNLAGWAFTTTGVCLSTYDGHEEKHEQ